MAWVSYQRILDGTSVSGKFGESMTVVEKWQIRVDSPATSKADILAGVTGEAGVTWGSSHFEFPALKALEFDLSPDGRDGMRWLLTVRYYVPEPKKRPKENGLPNDIWSRSGGTTNYPAFKDAADNSITNSAGDPLEGLQKEREETTWSLTKFYENDNDLNAHVASYDGKVNSAAWGGHDPKKWKCYFRGAKRVAATKLDGSDDAGELEYIEASWEFKLALDTWKLMPWDVGFMAFNPSSGVKETVLTGDGKPVKQPVALNTDGTKKPDGEKPDVANEGNGFDVYLTADWAAAFGTPQILT